MLRSWLAVVLAIFCFQSYAQTFTFNTTSLIPDDNSEACYPLSVSGLPNIIDTSFGVLNVCLNIDHTWDSDLELVLKAPDGTSIMLSQQNGGSDDNYTGTCFIMNASTAITNGFPPYNGSFIPEQSLNLANNGQDPNGIWQLCITDIFALADQGTLYSWSITFGANPPSDPPMPPAPCGTTNAVACMCPDSTSDCDLLPDMTASALIIQNQHTEYPGYMTISNATPNIGWGPMEVHGVNTCFCDTVPVSCSTVTCPNGDSPTQLVNQRIYHRSDSTMTWYDRPAGTMSYHSTHGHTHIDNWAEFTLRVQTSNPDPLSWPIVGEGAKISFCLINLGDCSSNYGYCVDSLGNVITMNDIPNAPFGLVSGCGVDQGIYTGNLDIYSEGLPGMELFFPGVCNGNYHIISITDPENNFLESNENNNWVSVPVTLSDQNTPSGVSSFTYSVTGNQVAFTNTTGLSSGYYWDFGDGTFDTLSNPVHTYAIPGNYVVKLIVLNQCYSPSTQTLVVTSAEETETSVYSSVLYPNPADQHFNLRYYLTRESEYQVTISTLTGSEVFRYSGSGVQGWNDNKITVPSHLAEGVYIVSIKAGVNSNFTKVIIRSNYE